MKTVLLCSVLTALSVNLLLGQTGNGTLKVFAEEPVIVYVDEVHYPEYKDISLVPGTHYLKALDKNEVKVYSDIVSIKSGQVTSILIEPQPVSQVSAHSGLTYGQTNEASGTGSPGNDAPVAEEAPSRPEQTIDIGQISGILPADLSGAFGLSFGMEMKDVDRIMTSRSARAQRNGDYYTYAIPYESTVYMVECRFIDRRLFQLIVGYPVLNTDKSKVRLDKKEIPFPEFDRMCNDLAAIYGEPVTAEKIFNGGYAENDGRMLEALRRKHALILYTWVNPANGNNIMCGLGYTTTPLAAVIYTSGSLGAEAQQRRLRINGYYYGKSFKDNYFSN